MTGAPNKGFLEQSITSDDNPFLRSNVQAIKAHQMKKKAIKGGQYILWTDNYWVIDNFTDT